MRTRLARTGAELLLDAGTLLRTDARLGLARAPSLVLVPESVALSESGLELLLVEPVALGELGLELLVADPVPLGQRALVRLLGARPLVGADVLLDLRLALRLLGLAAGATAALHAAADHHQAQPEQQHRRSARHEQTQRCEAHREEGQVEIHQRRHWLCPQHQQNTRRHSEGYENQAKEYHGETSRIGAPAAPFSLRP